MICQRIYFAFRIGVAQKISVVLKSHCGLRPITSSGIKRLSNFPTSTLPAICTPANFINQHFIHTSCISNGELKLHRQSENTFSHKILEDNGNYASLLAPNQPCLVDDALKFSEEEFDSYVSQYWENKTFTEIIEAFRNVSQHVYLNNLDLDISHEKFDTLCKAIIKNTESFDFDQMCNLLHCFTFWKPTESSKSHNFMEAWNALDQRCVQQIKVWNTQQLLHMCDHWHQLNLGGICAFNWFAINKLSRKTARLTPQQLVLTLYYINLRRTFPPAVDVIDYQVSVDKCAEELSLAELGVCALGFFKTQKKVRVPHLLETMIAKTKAEVNTADSITIASILKVCRSSLPVELADQLYDLFTALLCRIPELPLVCCLHILLGSSNIQMLHKDMMTAVVDRFLPLVSTSRVKDIERLTLVLSMFNWPSNIPGQPGRNLYELLAEEVGKPEREKEISMHPRCLTNFLHFISIMNVYPLHLIDKCLSLEFIGNVYSSSMQKVGQEVLSLDVGVELERPGYKGNKLESKTRRYLSKSVTLHPSKWHISVSPNKGTQGDRQLKEMIIATMDFVKDPNKFHVCHLLPNFFRPDIVFRLSEEDPTQLLPISDLVKNAEVGTIRRPQEPGIWVCLVLASWNLVIRGTVQPIGSLSQKLRLLKTIGYTPALVPWIDWNKAANKSEYIQGKLREISAMEMLLAKTQNSKL